MLVTATPLQRPDSGGRRILLSRSSNRERERWFPSTWKLHFWQTAQQLSIIFNMKVRCVGGVICWYLLYHLILAILVCVLMLLNQQSLMRNKPTNLIKPFNIFQHLSRNHMPNLRHPADTLRKTMGSRSPASGGLPPLSLCPSSLGETPILVEFHHHLIFSPSRWFFPSHSIPVIVKPWMNQWIGLREWFYHQI